MLLQRRHGLSLCDVIERVVLDDQLEAGGSGVGHVRSALGREKSAVAPRCRGVAAQRRVCQRELLYEASAVEVEEGLAAGPLHAEDAVVDVEVGNEVLLLVGVEHLTLQALQLEALEGDVVHVGAVAFLVQHARRVVVVYQYEGVLAELCGVDGGNALGVALDGDGGAHGERLADDILSHRGQTELDVGGVGAVLQVALQEVVQVGGLSSGLRCQLSQSLRHVDVDGGVGRAVDGGHNVEVLSGRSAVVADAGNGDGGLAASLHVVRVGHGVVHTLGQHGLAVLHGDGGLLGLAGVGQVVDGLRLYPAVLNDACVGGADQCVCGRHGEGPRVGGACDVDVLQHVDACGALRRLGFSW